MTYNFRIGKSSLQELLNKIAPVIPASSALPILQCVQLVGTPETLTVTATKLDNSIKAYSEYIITVDEFNVVFPFKRLKDIVTRADSGELDVTIVDNVATIISGATSWQVQLPSGETFPELPKIKTSIEVDGTAFRTAFSLVKKAASTDVTRPSLRMIHIANGKMTACDGIKFTQMNLGEAFPVELKIDIPSASADFVTHIIKDIDYLQLGYSDSHLILSGNNCSLLINNPTSSYPNVEQIMLRPALENKTELRVDKNDLLKAISRVRINADPDTEAIGLAIAPKSITVSSKDMTGNGASETIPAEWPSKDRILVVNYNLMMQLINNIESDDCVLYLGEDSKSRKSVILLKDESGIISLIPQMSGSIRIF